MPNVRYSSGAISTNRLPISLSRMRSFSSRTKAIVVAMDCWPDPFFTVAYVLSSGRGSGFDRTTRVGTYPPQPRRRSCMYCISSVSRPGW
ncbi:hypothetical protein STENM327S_02056 [Streptomyces tendae]